MTDEQVDETIQTAEEPPQEDSPEEQHVEAETAKMEEAEGYPASTTDGKTVRIVEKKPDPQYGTIVVDSDGNHYSVNEHGTLEAA